MYYRIFYNIFQSNVIVVLTFSSENYLVTRKIVVKLQDSGPWIKKNTISKPLRAIRAVGDNMN